MKHKQKRPVSSAEADLLIELHDTLLVTARTLCLSKVKSIPNPDDHFRITHIAALEIAWELAYENNKHDKSKALGIMSNNLNLITERYK